ncbi:protein of unknown function (DUF4200), putative [Trypanosoma equiperdum]|uniref:DUF4200 domain-containing protein n=2 Tax=Trypanozoon TaxID=39700 RepID=Q381R6_TRYB2|nr:hypothetical protein, conserved [Trypanosoma brucei brucei TREU927]EAN80465.1 hypothetical protein, conserved [Trypanosoma brucei brucei TREU927]SCU69791.1 Domain of unknown function (DUF4200), putative [Trypanosoma equiperdum]
MSFQKSPLLASNPFKEPLRSSGGGGGDLPGTINEHEVTVAQDIKQGDAKMAADLAILTGQPNVKNPVKQLLTQRENATTGSAPSHLNKSGQHTVEIREMHNTGTFIAKKREVGLMRLALANKESEIRHLEEEMDRVDKKLRQQQEQLASTEEKFNNFLKYSNLEQDAAVRRAERESKAKQKRLIDIKKLSAQINHLEQDMRKTEVQLELCMEYKTFMDNLTPPQFFFDVLTNFRVKEINGKILQETEAAYARQARKLRKQYEEAEARRASREAEKNSNNNAIFDDMDDSNKEDEEEEELIPLETQLEGLHRRFEEEANRRQAEEVEVIRNEISALTAEEVREALHNSYPHDKIPMYFTEPEQILDIFINVEEGNLFLIQNSQELEEELERVAMEFLHEREEMDAMVKQRQTQMDSLVSRIKESQDRLAQLEERLVDLESSDAAGLSMVDSAGGRGVAGYAKTVKVAMTQEVLKKSIEQTVGDIFRCINQRPTNPSRHQDGVDGGNSPVHPSGKRKHSAVVANRGPALDKKNAAKGKKKGQTASAVAPGATGPTGTQAESETSANMGPVEMLTIIENKVDEYHRYITDPKNGVEQSLIMSVLKTRDKERRHAARVLHLAKQLAEREERNQRALERSQATVVKYRGKPIMWRSRPPANALRRTEVDPNNPAPRDPEQDDEFFRA